MAANPICPRCSKPVSVGAYVCVEQGELIHLRCVSAETVLRAAPRAQEPVRQRPRRDQSTPERESGEPLPKAS